MKRKAKSANLLHQKVIFDVVWCRIEQVLPTTSAGPHRVWSTVYQGTDVCVWDTLDPITTFEALVGNVGLIYPEYLQ